MPALRSPCARHSPPIPPPMMVTINGILIRLASLSQGWFRYNANCHRLVSPLSAASVFHTIEQPCLQSVFLAPASLSTTPTRRLEIPLELARCYETKTQTRRQRNPTAEQLRRSWSCKRPNTVPTLSVCNARDRSGSKG